MSVFLIVFSDEIPPADITPRCVYGTIDAAEAALNKLIGGLKSFSPALYGEVYPFPIVDVEKAAAEARDRIWAAQKAPEVMADAVRVLAKHTLSKRWS